MCYACLALPVVPAKAGTQERLLDSCFRTNDEIIVLAHPDKKLDSGCIPVPAGFRNCYPICSTIDRHSGEGRNPGSWTLRSNGLLDPGFLPGRTLSIANAKINYRLRKAIFNDR